MSASELDDLDAELVIWAREIPDLEIVRCFTRVPAIVSRRNPYVLALRNAVGTALEGEALSIGRDGASDAVSFLEAGIPAVLALQAELIEP